jgi:hypothetical protein
MVISRDGMLLAIGLNTGEVHLCDARTGAELRRFRADGRLKGLPKGLLEQRFGGVGVSFSPNAKWLSTSAGDGSVRLWEVATGREVLRRDGHVGEVSELSFGAESRTVLTCGADAQAYLWSLRPPTAEEDKPSLDSLWTALAGEPAQAYRAIWQVSETSGAIAFLRNKIVPTKLVPEGRLRKLINDLDSEQFAVRESATRELQRLDALAEPLLRKALDDNPSSEARRRIERLLAQLEGLGTTGEPLRICRAIEVLEHISTEDAHRLLADLAGGAAGAWQTREAKAALDRLDRRPK